MSEQEHSRSPPAAGPCRTGPGAGEGRELGGGGAAFHRAFGEKITFVITFRNDSIFSAGGQGARPGET